MANSELATIALRHRGNLGGRLTDDRIPARVTIALTVEVAHHATAQHLLWMLANLLARQTVEIQEIRLDIPPGVPVAAALSPFFAPVSDGNTDSQHVGDLLECVRSGISALHPEIVSATAALGS